MTNELVLFWGTSLHALLRFGVLRDSFLITAFAFVPNSLYLSEKSNKIDILRADHVVGLSQASIEISIGFEILLLGGRASPF